MANFVALMDPDAERRGRFLRQAASRLDAVEGLRHGRLEGVGFGVVWATAPDAPVDVAHLGDRTALLFGDALEEEVRLDAEALLRRTESTGPPACDGYHALLVHGREESLMAAADRLGLFPIFHAWSEGGSVALVGSSPELFRLHPLFSPRPDLRGLVGLLLTHGAVGGRTLLDGVERLAVGHALVHTPREPGGQRIASRIEASVDLDPEDFDAHVELLDAAWRTTLDRHAKKDGPVGLLLSGGRDSRLIAGYLAELGRDVRALTLGRVSDYEVRCAAAVARGLGFEHRRVDVREDGLAEWAALQARWEHLAAGFSNVHTWAALPAMRTLGPHCVSGYLREVREVPLGAGGFQGWIDGPHGHGIQPDRVRDLLRPRFAAVVDEVVDELRLAWEASSDDPDDRAWRFLLEHVWRAHPGGVLWRYSLASWPVLPMLDRRLLELLASLPPATLAHRRSQDALLRRSFPALARLPLDRNGHDTVPLLPSLPRRLVNPPLVGLRRLRARLTGRPGERRYYRRVYDIEGRGWRAVRERAEPGREALAGVFDPEALERVLPPPPEPLRLAHPVRDGFAPKLLLGLALWATDHPI